MNRITDEGLNAITVSEGGEASALSRRTVLKGAAAVGLALGALAGAGFPAEAVEDKGLVYYMFPTLLDEFQTGSLKAFEQILPKLGYTLKSMDAQNRADLQLNQLDNVIALKPKALILNAVDVNTVGPAIEKAHAAGIPVLVFDRQIDSPPVEFTSVAGTVQIGRIAGRETVRLLTERKGSVKGTVLQILGDPGDSYTLGIQQGFEEIMKPYPDVKIITKAATGWEPSRAGNIAEDQLLATPNIDLIFAHAALLAVPVAAVLEQKGKKPGEILLVSSNGAPAGLDLIRKGWEQVEVEQPTYAQVDGIAMFLDKIIAKKPLKYGKYTVGGLESELRETKAGPVLEIPGSAITKANVDDKRFWGNQSVPSDPVTPVD